LPDLQCTALHELFSAVHHIPLALQPLDAAVATSRSIAPRAAWHSAARKYRCSREAFKAYDAKWGACFEHAGGRGASPASRLSAYAIGRESARTTEPQPFVHAYLRVLEEAFWVGAYSTHRAQELPQQVCEQLHSLMEAVHSIPTSLLRPDHSARPASRLLWALAQYDSAWGPRSAFGRRQSGQFIEPVSLVEVYTAAARATAACAQPSAASGKKHA
jgi:hypothetical protein